ncbi:hypothetical protein [Aquitalea pelogenes]|nr:hypothetical protein [Aquitalea pelogenes]
MRKFVMMALLTLATANVALAADASCDAKQPRRNWLVPPRPAS